jgi:hypothetical protein
VGTLTKEATLQGFIILKFNSASPPVLQGIDFNPTEEGAKAAATAWRAQATGNTAIVLRSDWLYR